VWDFSSIVWTDPDSRQRNLLLGQKIDFDIAVAGSARPAVGASLTPRAIGRVVGLQYWGVDNPVPLFQHLCHMEVGGSCEVQPATGVCLDDVVVMERFAWTPFCSQSAKKLSGGGIYSR
jgi:hypothetical protein